MKTKLDLSRISTTNAVLVVLNECYPEALTEIDIVYIINEEKKVPDNIRSNLSKLKSKGYITHRKNNTWVLSTKGKGTFF